MKISFANRRLLLAVLVTGAASLIVACGDSTPTPESVSSSYAGPGSRWDVVLETDNTFSITKRESASSPVVMTLTGNYETLESGFLKLAVESVDADSSVTNPPAPGIAAYALNVPGYVMIVKPFEEGSDQMIPMVAAGNCPDSNFDANWIVVKLEDGDNVSNNDVGVFGTFSYNANQGTLALPNTYALNQSSLPSNVIPVGDCNGGVAVVNNAAEMYLTNNGGVIARTGIETPDDDSDDRFYFAFAPQAIGEISNVAGDYAGLLFDASQNPGSQIAPVSISCDDAGSCTGRMVANIETNELSQGGATISLSNNVDVPGEGFVVGTITTSAPGSVAGNVACVVNIDILQTGKNIMSCAGQSPGDPTRMFNILLVSK